MEMIAKRAHDYANLASRSRANALDMFEAVCECKDLEVADLRRTSKKRKRGASCNIMRAMLSNIVQARRVLPLSSHPSPALHRRSCWAQTRRAQRPTFP